MASVVASRFSLLKVDADSDDDSRRKKKQADQKADKNAAKKTKKKKKANQRSTQDGELRSLAFGQSKGAAPGPRIPKTPVAAANDTSTEQFHDWQQADSEQVEHLFEQQLQEAIILSKVQQEVQTINPSPDGQINESSEPSDAQQKKKGKQKSNRLARPMTIQEYEKKTANAPEETKQPQKIAQGSDNFFNEVKSDATQMIRQEKLQEEYQKQFKVQSVLQAKFTEQLDEKDKEIIDLKEALQASQEELKQVKKRNKQLCFILAQGEMKEKAEIVKQVENLTLIKDELTVQLEEMGAELEKERSRNHSDASKSKGKK